MMICQSTESANQAIGMQTAKQAATRLLKTLGHAARLSLLCHLAEGEHCVSELESLTGIHQPTLSQQLSVLRDEQLVDTRRVGKQIYYQLKSQEALAVLNVLMQQFFLAKELQVS